ncbi:hypothetical protein PoB_006371400 [Plakobranchus ocellatus]|uniref:Sushi domain-containing protein n=1 Tax=Plakobranchus ocellatus TaxID=259542 RepID=A0AAV4CZ39_9GAST|nr:hypothetical protein PoB_006371400 [Plakobranchus ocellatus]
MLICNRLSASGSDPFSVTFDMVYHVLFIAMEHTYCKYKGRTIKHSASFQLSTTPCYTYICNNRKLEISHAECWWEGKCYKTGQILRVKSGKYQCVQTIGKNVGFKPVNVNRGSKINWKPGQMLKFPK